MNVKIYDTYREMSLAAANILIDLVNNKPNALLCIAGGDTPIGLVNELVRAYQEKRVDFTEAVFVGLDEWVGMGRSDEGSCQYFLYNQLFKRINAKEENIYFFDTKSSNLDGECLKIDNIIHSKGNLDLVVLGVGMNGHLGFNEPGVSFDLYSHVIDLDDTTATVGQKYFKVAQELQNGISLGIKHILEANQALLLANGTKKAEVIKKTLNEKISNQLPSTAIRLHDNAIVMLDKEAAELIPKR